MEVGLDKDKHLRKVLPRSDSPTKVVLTTESKQTFRFSSQASLGPAIQGWAQETHPTLFEESYRGGP